MSYIADTWYIKSKQQEILEILKDDDGWFICNPNIADWRFLCPDGDKASGVVSSETSNFDTEQDAIDCCEKYGYGWVLV